MSFKLLKKKNVDVDKEYWLGLRDAIPICLGYLAVSFAFGIKICAQGFPVWLAGLISLTNLTSAGQFAGTTLILEGASYFALGLSMLIINARYFLMSLSLSQNFDKSFTTFKRLSAAYGITDEIFAVSIGRGKSITTVYMFGITLLSTAGWVSGTVLGGIFSNILPDIIVGSLGIALYAMFLAIVIPPAKKEKPILFTVILAAVVSIAIAYVPFLSFISSGWSTIIVAIVVSAIAATFFPIKDDETDSDLATTADGNIENACAKAQDGIGGK